MRCILVTVVTGPADSHLVEYLLERNRFEIHRICRWHSPLDTIRHVLG